MIFNTIDRRSKRTDEKTFLEVLKILRNTDFLRLQQVLSGFHTSTYFTYVKGTRFRIFDKPVSTIYGINILETPGISHLRYTD